MDFAVLHIGVRHVQTVFSNNSYTIQLPHFEGPFDLLLFFIERDELDIYDIPIASITKDFLNYIHHLETLNIEVAAEFILVASTLMKIKAKMLLPRPVIKEDGTEEDPRTELVNRLLEYKRYKNVLEELREFEERASLVATRGNLKKEEKLVSKMENPGEELQGLDLYKLMKAFARVWERHEYRLKKPRHVIRKYPYTTEGVKEEIKTKLATTPKVDFVQLVMEHPEKIYCVFSFLAILEMTQQQLIKVVIGNGYNNFWVVSNAAANAA